MITSALSIVQQWHVALNTAQVDAMMVLVHPQIEVGGPRGTTRGVHVVQEWFGRANMRLFPQRWFGSGDQVVVEEIGEWRSTDTNQITGNQIVATVFRVDAAGLITRLVRHDNLLAALEDVCLDLEDEVKMG